MRLAELGAKVYAAVHSKKNLWRLQSVSPAVSILEGDLSLSVEAKRVLEASRPSTVFNVASSLNTARSLDIAEMVIQNTYGITHNVITAAVQVGAERYIQFGSIEEYGTGKSPFTESDREEPFSPYSLGKVMGTHLALLIGRLTNLKVTVVRPAATYGPGQNFGMLIPNLIKAGIEGRDFDMNPGEQLRDFLYVDDLVEGVLRSGMHPEAGGHIFNLGSGRGEKVKNVATMVNEAMGNPILINFGTQSYRPRDVKVFYMSSVKAKKLLGWEPRVNLIEGIAKTVVWYRQHAEFMSAYATVAK